LKFKKHFALSFFKNFKRELEKLATSFLGNEIKVFSVQMSENEFVLDVSFEDQTVFSFLIYRFNIFGF